MNDAVYTRLMAHISRHWSSSAPMQEWFHNYFAVRKAVERAQTTDLLPSIICSTLGGDFEKALPLSASWTMFCAAAHAFNQAQDRNELAAINDGIYAIGQANLLLADLDCDEETLRDILNAFGTAVSIGADAQAAELQQGRDWTRQAYFQYVLGKAAVIISTGVWVGGRFVTNDSDTLTVLRDFGTALGMLIQLSDDVLDLTADLQQGTFTLPVIYAQSLNDHPCYERFTYLLDQVRNDKKECLIEELVTIIKQMGAIEYCQRVANAYKLQAQAAYQVIPSLEKHLDSYVSGN